MRTHTRAALSAALVLVSTSVAAAQDPMMGKPAPELKKLEPLLGHWTGKGKVRMGAGQPPMDWTSKSHARFVLDGHFVQEDVEIQLAMMPAPLKMRSYYGWDRENQRFMAIGLGTPGTIDIAQMHWTGPKTMVQISKKMEDGVPTLDRWVSEIGEDTVSFQGMRMAGSAEPFVHVEGVNTRSKEPTGIEAKAIEASTGGMNAFAHPQVAAHIGKLKGMVGKYQFAGSMVMGPGMPKMKISGKENVSMGFENTTVIMHTIGDPTPEMAGHVYEAFAFIAWDETRNCYRSGSVNNLGEIHSSEWRLREGSLLGAMNGKVMGQYSQSRMQLEFDESGALKSTKAHALTEKLDPMVVFSGTYTKAE